MSELTKPLAGIKVLDISRVLAGLGAAKCLRIWGRT